MFSIYVEYLLHLNFACLRSKINIELIEMVVIENGNYHWTHQ